MRHRSASASEPDVATRLRWAQALVCVATIATAVAVPGLARAVDPTPGPSTGVKAGSAGADTGVRRWAVRPAGKDGKPDARTHFTEQGTPGTAVADTALVANLSPVAVTFQIYGTDAFNTPTGAFDLLGVQKTPTDLGSWMAFEHHEVSVPAGGSVLVGFTIVIPASATPGDHAGGLVVSLIAQGSGSQRVNVESRVAVRVYLRIPGDLRPLLAVTGVRAAYHGTANPVGHGRVAVTYTVTNRGNIRLRSHPRLVVTNAAGRPMATLTPTDLPELLPGQSVTFTATATRVFPAGPLTVKARLTGLADPEQPVGQVIPAVAASGYLWAMPWLLMLLVVVLVLACAGLWWLRSRRIMARLRRSVGVATTGGDR